MKLSSFAGEAETEVDPDDDPTPECGRVAIVGEPENEFVELASVHPEETPMAVEEFTTTMLTARLFAAVAVIAGQVTAFEVFVLEDVVPIGLLPTTPLN
ncbi:hypothetical protein JQ615_36820 [Bradyrhizobium jicamae]|uniref:Uncharacterized protein n=1 Tax=Bradyrhizobium jicamae TaxID=280332 RepID=A0ABS5FXG7_9BRAD|nr:hypothetical protein [Bradyrhizobium jicamae]MBR0800941.1 hypothetical protein [Bradyrhizobium jicamae]